MGASRSCALIAPDLKSLPRKNVMLGNPITYHYAYHLQSCTVEFISIRFFYVIFSKQTPVSEFTPGYSTCTAACTFSAIASPKPSRSRREQLERLGNRSNWSPLAKMLLHVRLSGLCLVAATAGDLACEPALPTIRCTVLYYLVQF